MNEITRRQLLTALLGGTLSATGTVVLARATPAGEASSGTPPAPGDVVERADRLTGCVLPEPDEVYPIAFLNRAFRNGGFRNGGFINGGFRNGGFINGGFRNGGFRNGSFRNW